MTAEGPVQGWAEPVVAYLRATLPREDETSAVESRLGWSHMFSTAYQISCMGLIALGEATEQDWGATPRTPPVRPTVLPRWDDVTVAVLWLAEQQSQLQWRPPDGSVPSKRSGQYVIHAINLPAPARPTIAAAHGCHPARASAEVMEVLSALGLVTGGAWTKAAEQVLWRCGARASALTAETDPRFAAAIETCIATMPPDVRAGLAQLATISEAKIAAERDRWKAQMADFAARRPGISAQASPNDEGHRRSLAFRRINDADWLFFRRWRLPDGWLSPADATRALEVFHDPLATAMRRAVVNHLYPGSDLDAADPAAKSLP